MHTYNGCKAWQSDYSRTMHNSHVSWMLFYLWAWFVSAVLLILSVSTQGAEVNDVYLKALVGSEVVLPCDCGVVGKLHPSDPPKTPFTVHWFRYRDSRRTPIVSKWTNGTQVHFGDWTDSGVIVSGSSLKISNLNYPRDHGDFVCSIDSDVAVIVTVLVPVTNVSIIGARMVNGDRILDVSARKSQIITCRAYAFPAPVFKWSLGSLQWDSSKEVPTNSPHTASIRFMAARNMHGRVLKCEAKNVLSNFIETTVKLNVLYKPTIKSVSSHESTTFVQGDTLKLQCKADGNPKPSFEWRRLTNLSDDIISNTDSYHIDALTVTQSGRYQCTAINVEGKASRVVSITVNKPFAVHFDKKTQKLECIAKSTLSNNVFGPWEQRLGGKVVRRKQGQITLMTNVLQFSRPTYQDSGYYVCTGIRENKTIRSDKYYIKHDTKPVFQAGQQTSYFVELGSNLDIRVLFYAYPATRRVRWVMLNDDKSTYVTDRYRTEKLEPANLTLTFYRTEATILGTAAFSGMDGIEHSDEGNYSLMVLNSIGKSTFQFSVSVATFNGGRSTLPPLHPAAVTGIVVGGSLLVILIVVLVLVRCGSLPRTHLRTTSSYDSLLYQPADELEISK